MSWWQCLERPTYKKKTCLEFNFEQRDPHVFWNTTFLLSWFFGTFLKPSLKPNWTLLTTKSFSNDKDNVFFLQSLKRIDIKSVVSLKRQSHDWSLLFDTLWKFLPPSFSFLIWKSLTSCTFRKNCHTNPLIKISNFIFAIFFHYYYTMAVGCPLHGNSI